MKYLERDTHSLSLKWALCLDEASFEKLTKKLCKSYEAPWVSHGGFASTHVLVNQDDGGKFVIVCMKPTWKSIQWIHGVLVHEAVHVWQEHIKIIGERWPSAEFEAYGIEAISYKLFHAYREMTAKKKPVARNKRKARRK